MRIAAVLAAVIVLVAVAVGPHDADGRRARTVRATDDRPPGAPVLSDAAAWARVRRSDWEPRPENAKANRQRPSGEALAAFRAAVRDQGVRGVTGAAAGTTDELIQWAAYKWGFDEDLLRALAVTETGWHQGKVGDGGHSFGIMQIKKTIWRGTHPLSAVSTAFNLDLCGAILRHVYDGEATWLGDEGYEAHDLWGSIGYYYSGHWYDDGARAKIRSVKRALEERAWREPDF